MEALDDAAKKGMLDGLETWMFTDNSTAESAYFRGTSSTRTLFELVLRLREMESRVDSRLFVVHVAGTRMQAQGTDGLSRGDHNAGVMTGSKMTGYVPLNATAWERSERLKGWMLDWLGEDAVCLSEDDWFLPQPAGGTYVWAPAPAAASAAVEQLAFSIHKRPNSVHGMVVPRLMTAWWRKVALRTCTLSFTVPVDCVVWKRDNFEPLMIFICLPLTRTEPWTLKGSERAKRVSRELSTVWETDFKRSGVILCKFLHTARAMAAMEWGVVRRVLRRRWVNGISRSDANRFRRVDLSGKEGQGQVYAGTKW